jgi:protein-S-isoprenylcysteine O-methyltransferase Ste14
MMTTVASLIIIACWLIFVGYWMSSARRVKPAAERQSRFSSLAHRAPLTLGGILLWFRSLPDPMSLAWLPHTDWARAAGAVVCALGLLVAIWSRRTLAGNWSSTVTFKLGHELIEAGPYRFARHPIYTGILLMALGTAMVGARLHCWLGFLMMCAGFWIKLTQEESLLLRHFPEDYPSYRARVKALVPFVI